MATIGGGAVTFIVGPVTGAALGASSDVIALSIAAGVIKSIAIMIVTPLVAKAAGLNSPAAAIVYGGLMESARGVAAGLAATDPKLVPYGAMTATFYTGLGCLLAPSALYISLAPFFNRMRLLFYATGARETYVFISTYEARANRDTGLTVHPGGRGGFPAKATG